MIRNSLRCVSSGPRTSRLRLVTGCRRSLTVGPRGRRSRKSGGATTSQGLAAVISYSFDRPQCAGVDPIDLGGAVGGYADACGQVALSV